MCKWKSSRISLLLNSAKSAPVLPNDGSQRHAWMRRWRESWYPGLACCPWKKLAASFWISSKSLITLKNWSIQTGTTTIWYFWCSIQQCSTPITAVKYWSKRRSNSQNQCWSAGVRWAARYLAGTSLSTSEWFSEMNTSFMTGASPCCSTMQATKIAKFPQWHLTS